MIWSPSFIVWCPRYVPLLGREEIVVVGKLYSAWLHRWRRRNYDPFRRRARVYFDLDGETQSTTVAQLHFFYMADMYGFLDYAALHHDRILAHMTATIQANAAAKAEEASKGVVSHRKALVKPAAAQGYVHEGSFKLTFAIGSRRDVEDIDDGEDAAQAAHMRALYGDDDEDDDGDVAA